MLDIKRIRKNPEELVAAMKARRGKGADVTEVLALDEKRRALIQKVEQLIKMDPSEKNIIDDIVANLENIS